MWSEVFFMNLKDFKSNFTTFNQDKQVEYHLYQEMRSPIYKKLREDYIKAGKPFPEIHI